MDNSIVFKLQGYSQRIVTKLKDKMAQIFFHD